MKRNNRDNRLARLIIVIALVVILPAAMHYITYTMDGMPPSAAYTTTQAANQGAGGFWEGLWLGNLFGGGYNYRSTGGNAGTSTVSESSTSNNSSYSPDFSSDDEGDGGGFSFGGGGDD